VRILVAAIALTGPLWSALSFVANADTSITDSTNTINPNVITYRYTNHNVTAYTGLVDNPIGASGATLSVGDCAVHTTDGVYNHPIFPFGSTVKFDSTWSMSGSADQTPRNTFEYKLIF